MTAVAIAPGITIDIDDAPLSPREREALAWPEAILPSQWAAAHRVLERGEAYHYGPWRNETAPYLRGLMDIPLKPGVSEVYIMKSAQGGGSEAMRNLIGFMSEREPDPMGIALPNKEKGESIVRNRLIPLFRNTRSLAQLLTARAHDIKKSEIHLRNGMSIRLMWSGSPASMASDPMRFAFADEIDKFVVWAGREGKPIDLIRLRLRTYGDQALLFAISTPTTSAGEIARLFNSADHRLYYLIACPACATRQRLICDRDTFHFPRRDGESREAWADRVRRDPAACWYACRACSAPITEADRLRLIQTGLWATADARGLADGLIDDAEAIPSFPRGTRLGLHFSAFNYTWTPMCDIAAEFINSLGDLPKTFTFHTGTLGEPFHQKVESTQASAFSARAASAEMPEGVVAPWAVKILATVDTQKDHFWVVLRAWGPGMRSHRLWHGRVESPPAAGAADNFRGEFALLDQLLFESRWPAADNQRPPLAVELALIDSGGTRLAGELASRTMAVYRYALSRRASVRPIKGMARPSANGLFIAPGTGWYDPGSASKSRASGGAAPEKVTLWHLDTHHFQDELAELIARKIELPDPATGELLPVDAWQLNQNDEPTYNAHLSNMQKVLVAPKGSASAVETWTPVPAHARIDYHDCYDDVTEVLTHAGWKRFPALAARDRVATVDLATDRIEYQNFTNPISREYHGEMVKIGGVHLSRLDLLVTPNHRMVVYDRSRHRKPKIVTAAELGRMHSIKLTAKWFGCDPPLRRVPADNGSPEQLVDAADLARLVGWYVAEGTARSFVAQSQPSSVKRSILIYQDKPHGRSLLRHALSKLPWHFQESNRGYVITSAQVWSMLAPLGDQSERYIPRWILNSSPEVIQAFLDGYLAGDGWSDGTDHALTISRRLADDLQEAFVKTGSSATMHIRPAGQYHIRGRTGPTRQAYQVNRRKNPNAMLCNHDGKVNFQRVEYHGPVHCVTVPNGTLIVRRNGKTAVCGNCETYQIAAAYMARVHLLPPLEVIQQHRAAERAAERTPPQPFTTPDGRAYSILDRQ